MPFWPNGRMGLTGVGSKLMFIVMHDRDQKHVVMVDEINRFTTLLSSLEQKEEDLVTRLDVINSNVPLCQNSRKTASCYDDNIAAVKLK